MKTSTGIAMACAFGLLMNTSTISFAQGQHQHKKSNKVIVVPQKHSGHGHRQSDGWQRG